MKKAPRLALAAAAAVATTAGACDGPAMMMMMETPGPVMEAAPRYSTAAPLALQTATWNANMTDLGKIAAVTELYDDVVVYSDKGATVMSGAAVAAQDGSTTSWRGAATIPAADGNGSWAVGVDGAGRMKRLRARTTLEDVGDRYGLAKDPVSAIVNVAAGKVAFSLVSQIALADGAQVVRFDQIPLAGPCGGGGGRFGGAGPDGTAQVLDFAAGKRTIYPTKDAIGCAFGGDGGRLHVATQHGLYVEEDGKLVPLYKDAAIRFQSIAAAGGWIWAIGGGELYAIHDDAIAKTSGLGLGPGAVVRGAAGTDVWVVGDGKLARYNVPVSGDEAAWRMKVQPIYAKACSQCHAPGGSSGIPLATYLQWVGKRMAIYDRVVVKRDMPQGRTITDAERTAVADWTMMK